MASGSTMSAAGLLPAARSAAEVLAWSRTQVDPTLRAAVDTLPGSSRLVAGYHFGWWDQYGAPITADQGKAIRPALTLLSAATVAEPGPPVRPGVADPSVWAAAAVELVHNFSLLHDDVMDGDLTRRHRPTAWSVFGASAAILAGDALLALAFGVLTEASHPAVPDGVRLLNGAVQALTDGQHADVAFEDRADVSRLDCLAMTAGKTGSLLGCATALGARFGGGTADQVRHLHGFGERLGLAFQATDDLLGIWGDPMVTGKPAHADLRARKKSLPVVGALTAGNAAGRELAGLYQRAGSLSDAQLARAADLVAAAGGREWCTTQAEMLLGEALRHLRSAQPARRAAAELGALARLVTHRDR